jgi:hypothetical protein
MIQQKLFPFNLEMTNERLSSRSGLSLVIGFYKALGLSELTDKYLPHPLSNRGFKPSVFVNSLCLLLTSGGRSLDDIRELKEEKALFDITEIQIPDPTAIGNWLRRMGESGLHGLKKLRNEINKTIMEKEDIAGYTLDIDATEIVSEKRDAVYTYNKNKGYMPMLGFIAENGICINDDFREGNISPADDNLEFYIECKKSLPAGKKYERLRADSASYQAELINKLEEDNVEWAITARKDKSVKQAIQSIAQWIKHDDYEIAETIHSMDKTKSAFRLIVKREYRQPDLFEEEIYFYHAVATNIEDMSAADVLGFHNKRGQAENLNKEVKTGFGLEKMPCGEFSANAVFFRIGIIAYNLFVGFKKLFSPSMMNHTVSTFRWKIINIAGKVIKHSKNQILKLRVDISKFNLFLNIRQKILNFA